MKKLQEYPLHLNHKEGFQYKSTLNFYIFDAKIFLKNIKNINLHYKNVKITQIARNSKLQFSFIYAVKNLNFSKPIHCFLKNLDKDYMGEVKNRKIRKNGRLDS